MFTKLGRDEVRMARHMQDVLAIFAQGQIQGEAKIGHGGGCVCSPSSKNFFFRPEGHSNKPNS